MLAVGLNARSRIISNSAICSSLKWGLSLNVVMSRFDLSGFSYFEIYDFLVGLYAANICLSTLIARTLTTSSSMFKASSRYNIVNVLPWHFWGVSKLLNKNLLPFVSWQEYPNKTLPLTTSPVARWKSDMASCNAGNVAVTTPTVIGLPLAKKCSHLYTAKDFPLLRPPCSKTHLLSQFFTKCFRYTFPIPSVFIKKYFQNTLFIKGKKSYICSQNMLFECLMVLVKSFQVWIIKQTKTFYSQQLK